MSDESEPKVTPLGEPEAVPVFDCTVLVSKVDGQYIARSASLAGVTSTGPTERAALQQIVAAFKTELKRYETPSDIPFLVPELTPTSEEEVRLLAVHL